MQVKHKSSQKAINKVLCAYLVLLDACNGVLPKASASSAATDSKKSFFTLRDVADSGLFRLASD